MSSTHTIDTPQHTPLRDPARTEAVLRAVPAQLPAADAVVCWDTAEDAVLGHVLARELQVQLWVATEIAGILSLDGDLPQGARVVIASSRPTKPVDVTGLAGLVAHAGGRLVGFVGGEALTEARAELPDDVTVVVTDVG